MIVLANDGGGVRALSSLLILREIERSLQRKGLHESKRPCDWIDLSVGTSGGGLNTLLLARLRLSIQEAISVMEESSEAIFKASLWSKIKGAIFKRARLNPAAFIEKLRQVIKKATGNEDTPLKESGEVRCKA